MKKHLHFGGKCLMSFQNNQINVHEFCKVGVAKWVRSGVGEGKMRLGVKMGIVPNINYYGSILLGDSYKLL